ncbi:uncharacterized protein BT62DRAFT_159041 [Guyanagaster necrorhizus]|uniref:Uncharacterized protein n=1 Tax=Guyanagaster necrorhizus TaxID=856835 RepID=A0A9P7VQD6_9AGAR|nr:uncharacterized protein BT62DRAFT_159041 [Guyanagaster necrorhizus MCA 3950]KAG7445501.1 hypothetical protein BT62DRAFT_159041 [Guyanagaster necrorhizus MCA 3950]
MSVPVSLSSYTMDILCTHNIYLPYLAASSLAKVDIHSCIEDLASHFALLRDAPPTLQNLTMLLDEAVFGIWAALESSILDTNSLLDLARTVDRYISLPSTYSPPSHHPSPSTYANEKARRGSKLGSVLKLLDAAERRDARSKYNIFASQFNVLNSVITSLWTIFDSAVLLDCIPKLSYEPPQR